MSDDWGTDLPGMGDANDDGFGSADTSFGDWDVDGVDGTKVGSGNVKIDKAGFYHFGISAEAKPLTYEKDDMAKTRKPSILCTCKVLREVTGVAPAGALHFHDLVLGGKGGGPMTDRDRDCTLNFLVGMGVLHTKDGKVIDPETQSTKIRTSTLCTRINQLGQFVGKLNLNPANVGSDGRNYPDRIEFSFGRGAFLVTAKEVAHVPCNEEALKAAGIVRTAKPNV